MNKITVLINCDSGYVNQTCVLIKSLRRNTSSKYQYNFVLSHYIDKKISKHKINKLKSFIGNSDTFVEMKIDHKLPKYMCGLWPEEVLLKIITLFEMKFDEPKVLYLDSDVLITNNIDDFISKDIGNSIILGFDDAPYANKLNCGIMLINPFLFKKKFISIDNYIRLFGEAPYKFKSEQHFFWYYIPNETIVIDDYRLMMYSSRHFDGARFYEKGFVPTFIHYAGPEKPWVINSTCYYFWNYWKEAFSIFGLFKSTAIIIPSLIYRLIFLIRFGAKKFHE